MCPELSQDVSQDHFSRAFHQETFIHDKFEQQHTFVLNHVPHGALQYKPLDEHAHGAQGSPAGTHPPSCAALLRQVQLSQAIPTGMCGGLQHGQESYSPLPPPGAEEISTDYSLSMSCPNNQLMPEIDSAWMKDVLDEFLLTSHELPPLAPLAAINLPSLLSPLELSSKHELQMPVSPPPVPSPPPTVKQRVTGTEPRPFNLTETGEHLPAPAPAPAPKSPAKSKSSSPTPEPLKIRAPKRHHRDDSTRKQSKWAQKCNLINLDQVEHVIRERQRRDDMSSKIATLESLLPQGPKRDRASIVHDSVQYVKLLQQRVEELTKKYEELQLKRSSKFSSPVFVRREEVRASTPEETTKPFRLVNFHVQVEGGDDAATVSNCRCSLHFLSLTMKALEQLKLDLCRSNITMMPDGTYFCVIASKPRNGVSPVPSSSTLALKIKSAVESQ